MCRGHQHPDVSSESRVLYVDADPATAEAVRESLEADGRSVATAVDAEAGLERLEAAEPPEPCLGVDGRRNRSAVRLERFPDRLRRCRVGVDVQHP